MAITDVLINHTERNYFDDYSEIRSDHMTGVTPEKVEKAIDKLARRHRRGLYDCMFVTNDDGTGWRLTYDFDPELFEKGVHEKFLRLRHYTNMGIDSWDCEEGVSVTYAKQAIIGEG